jgi:hypothetical protein
MKLKHAVSLTLAGLTLAMGTAAHATTPGQTVLNFPLLHLPLLQKPSLDYTDTVGGKLHVASGTGSLSFSLLGYLGVESGGLFSALDPSLGKGESITFSFDKAVTLKAWDVDDFNPLVIIPDGNNKFGLSVDGGSTQSFAFGDHSAASLLTGKTFTFNYVGDNYFIDQLTFATASVPEATTAAQLGLGLGMIGLMFRRKRRAV